MNTMSRIRLELSFFPAFWKNVQESFSRIKDRVNQTILSLSLIIKIGSDHDEIRLTLGFSCIYSFVPVIFVTA